MDLLNTRKNIYDLVQTSNRILSIIDTAITGKNSIEGIDLSFNQAQKDALITKYTELKVQIKDIVSKL